MVMIAVVTALAMRLPNPRMVAIDFCTAPFRVTLGALYFLVIIPRPSKACFCSASPGGNGVLYRIEVQKHRLGSLGALASTINIIVLDNPMTFHFSQFWTAH
ncbi:hypothetical protein ACNKHO_20495 [Shigella flexneri]